MKLIPIFMLILLIGCVKKGAEQPAGNETQVPVQPPVVPTGPCSDGIWNQGETGLDCGGPCPNPCSGQPSQPPVAPPVVKSASMLPAFGLKVEGDPFKKGWSAIYSYYLQPGCTADLYITDEACLERTNEGAGYANKTWCESNKTFTLSSRCLAQSVASIQSSLLSDTSNLTKDIPLYLPSKAVGITLRIDESYDWGDVSFVYTNHGVYPALSKSTSVSGQQVFCADSICKTAYIMLDHPAKYLRISAPDTQKTMEAMTRFIEANAAHIYQPRMSSLSFMSDAYAFNRAVKVCAYPYGLMRAEKVKVDWTTGMFLTDLQFTRTYWPFSFYYDTALWSKPDVIGTQFNLMTGEFSFVKRLSDAGKYQLCSSESMPICSEACSADDVLAVGSCTSSGMVPLQSDLPAIISQFKALYAPSSFKDPACFYLFDYQGEQDLLQSLSTGNGMAALKLDKTSPTVMVIAFKGTVNVPMAEAILKRRYGISRLTLNRIEIDEDCMQYEYDNGYVAVCDFRNLSYLAFDMCDKKADCKPGIDAAMQSLKAQIV